MSAPRLASHLILSSLLGQCSAQAIPAYMRHKGDRDRGQVILVCAPPGGGTILYERGTSFTGELVWRRRAGPFDTDRDISEALHKITSFDQEANILEVEVAIDMLVLDGSVED